MTVYLATAEILTMHYILIERYGGSHGVRDPGALDAALYRPQSGYYGDIIQEAAALWESITLNHPFIDGNKRIGFAAVDTFLRINGYSIISGSDDIWSFINGLLADNIFEYDRLEAWLRENTEKLIDDD